MSDDADTAQKIKKILQQNVFQCIWKTIAISALPYAFYGRYRKEITKGCSAKVYLNSTKISLIYGCHSLRGINEIFSTKIGMQKISVKSCLLQKLNRIIILILKLGSFINYLASLQFDFIKFLEGRHS